MPNQPDPDGTIRTPNEQRYGVARNRRICFVSAGPDQGFGNLTAMPPYPADPDPVRDNIYSYPINAP